jgi:hypothetical protein
MDTKFRILEQLEQDLKVAAAREHALKAAPVAPRTRGRRSDRRGITWTPGTIAAALVALLVIAGTIGVLSGLGGDGSQAESFGGSGAEAPAGAPSKAAPGVGSGTSFGSDEEGVPTTDSVQGFNAAEQLEDDRTRSEKPSLRQDLTKIVRDGSITVVVPTDGFGEAFDRATAIAEEAGGFVLSSSISQEN